MPKPEEADQVNQDAEVELQIQPLSEEIMQRIKGEGLKYIQDKNDKELEALHDQTAEVIERYKSSPIDIIPVNDVKSTNMHFGLIKSQPIIHIGDLADKEVILKFAPLFEGEVSGATVFQDPEYGSAHDFSNPHSSPFHYNFDVRLIGVEGEYNTQETSVSITE